MKRVLTAVVSVAVVVGAVLLAKDDASGTAEVRIAGKPSGFKADLLAEDALKVAVKDLDDGQLAASKLGVTATGDVVAYVEVELEADAGTQRVILDKPPCARRVSDAGTCTRLDGGDQGLLNRYLSSELTGPDCELVACSVWAGQDSEL